MVNLEFSSDEYRKIRMTYYDAGDNTQVFNAVWYPDPKYNLPVLGIDLLAFNRKKYLAIVDFQPLHEEEGDHAATFEHLLQPIKEQYDSLKGRTLVQWMHDNLRLIDSATDIENLARTVDDNGGIYFVPAFSGLYAPYWRSDVRGVIVGMTRYVNRGHFARPRWRQRPTRRGEVLDAMHRDSGVELQALKVDGGMVHNELLMQFQADVLGVPVVRARAVSETTALGAAYAAGLAVGFWKTLDETRANWGVDKVWQPSADDAPRTDALRQWKKAVTRTFDWVED